MHRVLKATFLLALGATVLTFAGGQKNRARVLRWLKRPELPEGAVAANVLSKLERLTPHAGAIRTSTEHGCVVLTGDVLTAERGAIVQAVARVRGVDAVIDLMTEHRSAAEMPRHVGFERRSSWPGAGGRRPTSPW
jgi:hypothetical protein